MTCETEQQSNSLPPAAETAETRNGKMSRLVLLVLPELPGPEQMMSPVSRSALQSCVTCGTVKEHHEASKMSLFVSVYHEDGRLIERQETQCSCKN